MVHSAIEDKLIKQTLALAKTIAMVGVSSIKKEEFSNIKRKPSIIVMKYLQEFGYRVVPVNPSAAGKQIHQEIVVAKLEDINIPIDIVNVFRPSIETPLIAEQAIKIGAKAIWLQYGVQNEKTQKIAKSKKITYIANKCKKQK